MSTCQGQWKLLTGKAFNQFDENTYPTNFGKQQRNTESDKIHKTFNGNLKFMKNTNLPQNLLAPLFLDQVSICSFFVFCRASSQDRTNEIFYFQLENFLIAPCALCVFVLEQGCQGSSLQIIETFPICPPRSTSFSFSSHICEKKSGRNICKKITVSR